MLKITGVLHTGSACPRENVISDFYNLKWRLKVNQSKTSFTKQNKKKTGYVRRLYFNITIYANNHS